MARSRDWDELQHIWLEYRRKSGREMRDNYAQLIDVMNEIAYANNITNGGEYWYSAFESYNFREDLERVWEEIKPLYEGLHAYVRRKLREYYGPDKINRNAPIPAHILGDMYGQSWSHILDIILPYPGRNFIDITPKMVEELYTPPTLFQVAQDFFASLNFT
uniref:Angiotensin-converting enzyme n=1 Tax=Megaselia scalaris TaxID=36166 RepID=T1H067_MEGSC